MTDKGPAYSRSGIGNALKVLHLISSRGLYGAERVALELCKSLRSLGCEAVIGVIKNSHNPHVEIAEEAKRSALETVIFPCDAQFDRNVVRDIRRFIEKNGIDIVNCHGYKSNFYGFFATRNRIPIVTTNHNWLTSHWKLKVYCFLDSLWMRYFDRIIAVSEGVKEVMLKYGIPENKITVVDNGIDLSRFGDATSPGDIRNGLGLPDDARIIGTVGSLTHEKGQIFFLQAAAAVIQKHKNAFLVLAGDGPLRAELEQECVRLGIESNVRFAGYRSDVPAILSALEIFVLPSIKEGLPMVLLEAMAAKKPVIASRVGAIPKVLDGNNGTLIEPGDVHGLATAIIRLLDAPAMTLKMSVAGYEKVKAEFSSDTMGDKYYRLYRDVLGRDS